VEGRASPEGNSRQAAVVRTLSRVTTSIRLAAVRRTAGGFKPRAADVRPEGGARCVSSARRDLCGGRGAILVPTATSAVAGRGGGFLRWTCRAGTRPPGQPVTLSGSPRLIRRGQVQRASPLIGTAGRSVAFERHWPSSRAATRRPGSPLLRPAPGSFWRRRRRGYVPRLWFRPQLPS
jgi:hypothetical protein